MNSISASSPLICSSLSIPSPQHLSFIMLVCLWLSVLPGFLLSATLHVWTHLPSPAQHKVKRNSNLRINIYKRKSQVFNMRDAKQTIINMWSSLTSPERLLRPADPEGWCCSYPRSQSCTDKCACYVNIFHCFPFRVIINTFVFWCWCTKTVIKFLDAWDPWIFIYLSLELICRAFASILAPMSPIALPLMSSLVRDELLPSALRTMVRSLFSLESAREREVRGCGERRGM